MRNKLLAQLRRYAMVQHGDRVICAVSGGADSMALLWGMYLLQDKLQIRVEAAHFDHGLRGEESRRDAAFVKAFCQTHGICCHMGSGTVQAGAKGLEAAAREARYAFLEALPGKIATAHTADDNAETVLMHLIRGTGLTGLGGIAPVRGKILRPMLTVTRQEVLAFLSSQEIPYVSDSTNDSDDFLRNRLRHHVIPLLKAENPSLAQSLSDMAMGLRLDAEFLDAQTELTTDVAALRQMPPALQSRALAKLLQNWGVPEPERTHIDLLHSLVVSENPSAAADFPGGVTIGRAYGQLVRNPDLPEIEPIRLQVPGLTRIPELDLQIQCVSIEDEGYTGGLCLKLYENPVLRSRRAGDTITLPGGSKSLKKLFIDRKIPAARRGRVPVIADEHGVAAVLGIGPNRERLEDANIRILVNHQPQAEE